MDQGQEKFFNFIMQRVQDDKREEAKKLLNDNFTKQAAGEFNQEAMKNSISKILKILKPEHLEEVKGIMQQFGKQHIQ